jgi:two-component system response regulator RegA
VNATSSPSILIVDDDDVFRQRLGRAFQDRGFEVFLASSDKAALELARAESPEFAVIDLRMPGDGGLALLRALIELDATTRAVLLTGYGSIRTAVSAMQQGAVNYLTKPATVDAILAALRGEDASPEAEVPSLARVEWEHIQRVMTDCDGNISMAARALGMHRRSLQRKLSKDPVPK